MTTNSTVDMIDKTLSIENAPADAKATGDALAGKLGLHAAADNGVVASGANYVRLGNGTQICWGYTNKITAGTIFTATFPVPFANNSAAVTINRYQSPQNANVKGNANICSIEATKFLAVLEDGINSTWIAIGRWK